MKIAAVILNTALCLSKLLSTHQATDSRNLKKIGSFLISVQFFHLGASCLIILSVHRDLIKQQFYGVETCTDVTFILFCTEVRE